MRSVAFLTAALLASATPATDPPKVDLKKGVEFTGRAEVAVVEIRPRVTGYLDRVLVKEGAAVKKGEVLAEVDARPYQAKLGLVKAELAVAIGHMKFAEAARARAKDVYDKGAGSKFDVETSAAAHDEAKSRVGVAEAVVRIAELDLDYTKLVSPIDGRVGRVVTPPGNLLKADDTLVLSVTSDSTVTVAFDVDERTMIAIRRATRDNGGKPAVEVGLIDEDGFPHPAALQLHDTQVDVNTGTVRARATLPNPDGLIVGGSFLRVRLTVVPGK